MVKRYNNQNYSKLRRQHQQSRTLFTDPTFPANASSLWKSGKSEKEIVWKRPSELCDNPKLVVDGVNPDDLNQGSLGNCWFIAACTSLSLDQKAWNRVVPDSNHQEWNDQHPEQYCGIFHFHFWRLGEWVDVVIDDLLPTMDGHLVYMKSKSNNEFWGALLEKAYAKMAGCYEALIGGQTGDAMVDFTGGADEYLDLVGGGYRGDEEKTKALFKRLRAAHDNKSFMSCSIAAKPEEVESKAEHGLIRGHAYCITDVRKVKIDQSMFSIFGNASKLFMIKVRNPWGQKEWTGPWSDESEEWKRVPNSEKKRMGFNVEDDGEFWMAFTDWINNFTNVSICRAVNTSFFSLQKTWHEASYHGTWGGNFAGGCINNRDTFLNNPQYSFDVTSHKHGSVMVSLLQKDSRSEKSRSNLSIGFNIMKVEENRRYRVHVIHESVGSVTYTNSRSVFQNFDLPEGRYVILPTTFEPGQEGTFMLRIFTENNSHSRQLSKDVPGRGMMYYLCCCCVRYPQALVTVHMDSATGLEKQDFVGVGADPYCIVKCGGKKAEIHCVRNTLEPKFDTRLSFYVTDRATDVVVQVWNANVLVDRFMGQVSVPIPWQGDSERHTMTLMGRGRNSGNETHGKLTFSVSASRDLQST